MTDPWIAPPPRVLRVGRADVSPVVQLPSRAPSPVVRVQVPGPVGPPGAAGHDGAGTDYGFIRYDEMAGLEPTPLLPGQLTPFIVTQPNIVRDKLKDIFAGHQFLDAGNVLRARADGDSYTVRPRLLIRAAQAGGSFQIGAMVRGNVSGIDGFVASRKVELSAAAGVWEVVDIDFLLFPQSGFRANGGLIMMQCSVPAQASAETLFVLPEVAG